MLLFAMETATADEEGLRVILLRSSGQNNLTYWRMMMLDMDSLMYSRLDVPSYWSITNESFDGLDVAKSAFMRHLVLEDDICEVDVPLKLIEETPGAVSGETSKTMLFESGVLELANCRVASGLDVPMPTNPPPTILINSLEEE